jgi:3-isopropylmalate/(R)-2-methylmalate dehydratase large subunit
VGKRRKIPTKAELVQLQKLYRTDEKIGERLGGVPAYLVAYWRRKKGVPRHSLPKFSEKEIRSLWERHGDDDRCGLELGISKAAFYNWRRRYNIREKPAFLKLEQLELAFPGMQTPSHSAALWGKQTVAQKIIARAAGNLTIEVGDKVMAEPDLALVHECAPLVIEQFQNNTGDYVWNTLKTALSLCSEYPDVKVDIPNVHKTVREFASRQRLKFLYDFSEGSARQVAIERGHVLPGQLEVGTSGHQTAFGALAGLGWVITPEQMALVLSTGTVELTAPGSVRVDISGRRSRGVYTKDVALSITQRLQKEPVAGKVVEYYGSAISHMTVSERFTLCGMATAFGAVSAICQFDSSTRRYLMGRTTATLVPVLADKNAVYEEVYQINIDHLVPQIAGPNGVQEIRPVAELENLPVRSIVIGTGTNGRFDDLRLAAEVVKGKTVHSDCRLAICPSSRATYLEALKKGLIRVFAEAGAVVMTPGTYGAYGPAWSHLNEGERSLITGSHLQINPACAARGEVYLCSPVTAAASALNGAITDPTRYGK